MSKRISLASLSSKLASKPASQQAAPLEAPDDGERDARGRRKTQADGRKGILLRAHPETWRELKRLAVERDAKIQDLLVEAVSNLLAKYGHPGDWR